MDYKTMKIEQIIEWCKANNEVAWLKDFVTTKVPVKVYPKVKGEDGKMKADKTATPKTEMRKPTFLQIKKAFAKKFMPEIIPTASEEKVTMYDIIAAL